MTVFHIDSTDVFSRTAALQRDAAALNPLTPLNVAPVGPLAEFSTALSSCIARSNARADMLRNEAQRVAELMQLTVEAAGAVDTCTAHTLEAAL